MLVHGEDPDGHIDHVNGDRSDNRIQNLRLVDAQINNENRRTCNSNNRSGFLGVCWDKQASKWKANITCGGKLKHLGFAATPELAHELYVQAKRQMHEGSTL